LQTDNLNSQQHAEQRRAFIDTYRSYIINYVPGMDMVQSWVERQGPDRWISMGHLLSSQLLPVKLLERLQLLKLFLQRRILDLWHHLAPI